MPSNDEDNLTTAATIIPHHSITDDGEVQEYSIKTTTTMFSSSNNRGELKEQSPMPDEKEIEEKEEQICKSSKSKLDWEALIAAAEEDFDLLESPMDAAVKTLMTGKEIQKLSVIRTMPETISTYGDEAINRLLPLIQDMVSSEVSLDVHCDSSDLFKTLIKDKSYESKFPGLTDKLLSYILENIDRVKDNVAAAAWLETLFDIVECIQPQAVTELIVPLTVSQAVSTKRIQRRVIAARLIEKLCAIVPVESIKKDLAPCTKMLCQDPNATVRTAIAQRLSVIAQSLNNSSDCVSLLLPCLIELCKDDDSGVREAILNTIAVCLPYFTKESRKTVVLPLLRKCTEQALILRDTSLAVVSKQLAPWLYALKDILSPQETRWFLDTYCRIVNMSVPDSDKSLQLLALTCRRSCAYNFPCFAMIYSGDLFNDKLLPILERFCYENDEEIRSTIAAGFHEILLLRPDEPSLLHIFTELIKTGAVEIIQHLVKDLHKAIPLLYQMVKKEQEKRSPKTTRVQLDRLIVGCNRLVRNTGNWRSHESYLMNLIVLKKILPPNDLFVTFVPMLKQEVLTAHALPCRIAAAVALLHLMREFPLSKNRQNVIEFFTKTVGQHQSCHKRRILLDIVPMLLHHFSRDFFKENFLQAILKLANDQVSNIRLQLCRMMPRIKKFLFFPDDEPAILSLEKSVRSLLTSESSSNNDRHLLQQYACDLSRSETTESLKSDATKVAEEKRLWTEIDTSAGSGGSNAEDEGGNPPSPIIQKAKKGVTHRRKNGALVTVGADGVTTTTTSTVPNNTSLSSPSAYASSTISRINGISSSRPPTGISSSSISDIHADKPPTWKTTRPDKTKIAVVRPQPQVIITQRSPSPMPPKVEDTKPSSKLPLSTRYRSYHSSASSSPTTSSPPSTTRYRSTYRSDSTPSSPSTTNRSPLSSYSTTRHSSYTPTSSPLMSKSMTSSYTAGSTSSYSPSSGLMSSRSMSQIRRPYSLMKVQSSSAIEHKPTNIKLRVTGMS